MKEASIAVSLAYDQRRMSLRESKVTRRESKATRRESQAYLQQIDEDARQREEIKKKLSKISSVSNFEKRGGKIKHFILDRHQKTQISMEEMILIGYQASEKRSSKERADPKFLTEGCNMQAPKSAKRQQQVFVVNSIDQRCLNILFNAFQLNKLILKEINLKQLFTKIVPYKHSEYNNTLV